VRAPAEVVIKPAQKAIIIQKSGRSAIAAIYYQDPENAGETFLAVLRILNAFALLSLVCAVIPLVL
jgi:hypothetical protein